MYSKFKGTHNIITGTKRWGLEDTLLTGNRRVNFNGYTLQYDNISSQNLSVLDSFVYRNPAHPLARVKYYYNFNAGSGVGAGLITQFFDSSNNLMGQMDGRYLQWGSGAIDRQTGTYYPNVANSYMGISAGTTWYNNFVGIQGTGTGFALHPTNNQIYAFTDLLGYSPFGGTRYNLGTSGIRWKRAYLDTLDATTILGSTSFSVGNADSLGHVSASSYLTTASASATYQPLSTAVKFKSVATFALMIADGTPAVTTIYEVTNDENKSYTRSTYLWKPNGNREWVATTPDN